MAAKHFYRPRNAAVLEKYKAQFPPLKTFTIDEVFGGWANAQQTHFVNGATFDQIYNSSVNNPVRLFQLLLKSLLWEAFLIMNAV